MTFTSPNGGRPSEFILKMAQGSQPTIGEGMLAAQSLRTRIRERSASQLDYMGASWAQLSDKYASRKIRNLGVGMADLFGYQNHPHMLNAIQVVGNGNQMSMSGSEMGSLFGIEMAPEAAAASGDISPARMVSLVIPDGPEAIRARAHNEGATIKTRLGTGKGKAKKGGKASFTLPTRRFFDASPDDLEFMVFLMGHKRDERLRAISGAAGAGPRVP